MHSLFEDILGYLEYFGMFRDISGCFGIFVQKEEQTELLHKATPGVIVQVYNTSIGRGFLSDLFPPQREHSVCVG